MRATGTRRFDGLTTREAIFEKVLLSRFMSLLAPDCYTCVAARNPKNGEEAAEMMAEFEHRGEFSKTYLAGEATGRPHFQTGHYYSKREQGFGGVAMEGSGVFVEQGNARVGYSRPSSPQNQSEDGGQAVEREGGQAVERDGRHDFVREGSRQVQHHQGGRKPVTCYGCGVVGHIKPNCPNKIRSVKVLPPQKHGTGWPMIDGWLAGLDVSGMKFDTGADRTLVRNEFVSEAAYTGKSIVLDSWRGCQTSRHRLARIVIKVGSVEELKEVVVVDGFEYPALLGCDLCRPLQKELISRTLAQLEGGAQGSELEKGNLVAPVSITSAPANCEQVEVESTASVRMIREIAYGEKVVEKLIAPVRITRAQATVAVEQEEAVEQESALPDCVPTTLGEVFDFSDCFFEVDPVVITVDELPGLPGEEVDEIPLPNFVCDVSESGQLVMEKKDDEFLMQVASCAEVGDEIPLPVIDCVDAHEKLLLVQQDVGFGTCVFDVAQKDEIASFLVQNRSERSVKVTKATRESSPVRVFFSDFLFAMLMCFILVWCVILLVTLHSLCFQFVVLPDVLGVGYCAVLWRLSRFEKLQKPLLPWSLLLKSRTFCLLHFGFLWSFRGGGERGFIRTFGHS